jgi:hypothetical protein
MNRYTVSTRDPGDTPDEDWAWVPFASTASPWGLRLILRELYGFGYGDLSVLVQRLAPQADPPFS